MALGRRKAQAASGGNGTRKFGAAATVIACVMMQVLATRRVGVSAFECQNYPMSCGGCEPGYRLLLDGQQCCTCFAGQWLGPSCGSENWCVWCGPGTYNPSEGATSSAACIPCPEGTYNPDPKGQSLAACLPCLAGTYNPSTAQPSCTPCTAGTYNPSTGSISSAACLPCASGTFSLGGQSSCTPCPAGTYNPSTGSTSSAACLACAAGKYNHLTGSTSLAACLPCPAGTYSVGGQSLCTPCAAGTYNPSIGSNSSAACLACAAGTFGAAASATSSSACQNCTLGNYCPSSALSAPKCCPIGSFASVTGLSVCAACPPGNDPSGSGCSRICTVTPNCDCTDVARCDRHSCPPGCYFDQNKCYQAPPGYFSACSSSECSASSNQKLPCPPGSYSQNFGAVSNMTCLVCPTGAYCTLAAPQSSPCAAGTFNPSQGEPTCAPCPPGKYQDQMGMTACTTCPVGTWCASKSVAPCSCPVNQYQPKDAQSSCLSCPNQVVPKTAQATCDSENPTSSADQKAYTIGLWVFAAVAAVSCVSFIAIVRSKHTFAVRPFHSALCLYVFMFTPYAALKFCAIWFLLSAKDQTQQLAAQVFLNASFTFYFVLGFGGKLALVQLWMHIIHRHTIAHTHATVALRSSQESVMRSADATWRGIKSVIVAVSILYCIGFFVLVGRFLTFSQQCAAQASIATCIPVNAAGVPSPCSNANVTTYIIDFYEGVWAGVVVIVFSIYTFLFNGIVYAVLTQKPDMSAFERMVMGSKVLWWLLKPFIQKGWTPDEARTSDELKAWRQVLRRLALKLAATSITSFVLKAVLELMAQLGANNDGSTSLNFALTTICAEGVPSLLSLIFLLQYHLAIAQDNRSRARVDVPMTESYRRDNCINDDAAFVGVDDTTGSVASAPVPNHAPDDQAKSLI